MLLRLKSGLPFRHTSL